MADQPVFAADYCHRCHDHNHALANSLTEKLRNTGQLHSNTSFDSLLKAEAGMQFPPNLNNMPAYPNNNFLEPANSYQHQMIDMPIFSAPVITDPQSLLRSYIKGFDEEPKAENDKSINDPDVEEKISELKEFAASEKIIKQDDASDTESDVDDHLKSMLDSLRSYYQDNLEHDEDLALNNALNTLKYGMYTPNINLYNDYELSHTHGNPVRNWDDMPVSEAEREMLADAGLLQKINTPFGPVYRPLEGQQSGNWKGMPESEEERELWAQEGRLRKINTPFGPVYRPLDEQA